MKVLFFFFQQVDLKKFENFESFDKISQLGSSTIIKFREIQTDPILEEFQQFLGISNQEEWQFDENMKISVISNVEIQKNEILTSFTFSNFDSKNEILSMIENDNSNILIFQIQCSETIDILVLFNDVLSDLNEFPFVSLLMTFKNDFEIEKPEYKFEQSYMRKNGKLIEKISKKKIGIFSSSFGNKSRIDVNQKFDLQNCFKNSGNGTILVDHILVELSFKLGFKKNTALKKNL
jgi:hypothetical protein